MSETGRKRSRKTKLVPREFADIIEEDSFLQVPPQKKSLLQTIKKEPGDHGSGEESSSSLQFSVKVEVEDIPDNFLDEDPSNYMKYLFSLSQESKSKNTRRSSTAKKPQDEERVYIMDPIKIHRLLPALHRRYPCDSEAVVATRNLWGKLFHEMAEGFPRSLQDTELQQTLNEWKSWHLCSRNRDTPLSYKCYVCGHAWWYFMDFKDHIKNHPDSYIKLEIVHQECHIICYEGEPPPVKEMYVAGKCSKCGMTFKEHQENKRFSDYSYYCVYCSDKFTTCGTLARHVGGCDKNPIRAMKVPNDIPLGQDGNMGFACQICDAYFVTRPEKEDHLSVCHSVRSDEPIAITYKICRLCDMPYFSFVYHVCPKRNIIHPCRYCDVKFQNKQMLDLHLKMAKKTTKCSVCHKFLPKSCLLVEHYVSHSNNFEIMFRCLTCKKIKLFHGDEAIKNHRVKNHRKFDNRRPGWEKILVPRLMLEQCQFNPNGRARKKVPDKTVRRYVPKSTENNVPKRTENNVTIAEDEELVIKKTNEVAKYYKKPKETTTKEVTDTARILEQITEYVDIKPDIIRVKEEMNDETEPPVPNAHTEAPRLNIEELQIAPEVSNVFQATQPTNDIVLPFDPENYIIKHEVKEEPVETDDLILISQQDESNSQASSDISDLSSLNLEPEVILKAGYRKRKVYKCSKCNYEGYHKEYKEHVNNKCMKVPPVVDSVDYTFKCTKCNKSFESMKTYAQHFVDHNCPYMACPQCFIEFDSITKLISHLNSHIKNQFLRIQLISDNEPDHHKKDFQCKTCKKVVFVKDMFDHWEGHLEILGDLSKPKNVVKKTMKPPAAKGVEYALGPEVLKRILELLDNSNNPLNVPRKIKTCFVCQRTFERQNDCKRHLIEHLLEDALANIAETGQLKCQVCRELFMKPDGYKKHMRDHGSLPIYQCSLCDKTFSDSSNFTKHKKIHNLKAFVCDLCHKKFQVKHSLEKHMKMHQTTNPYKCEPCNRIFLDRSFYNRHRRQLHERAVLRFKCFVCKEGFESLKEKWDHMWEAHKHRNNKADCPICKKPYRKYSDVKKHCQMEHSLNITLEGIIELMAQYRKVQGDADYEDRSDIISGEGSVAANSVENENLVENADAVSVENANAVSVENTDAASVNSEVVSGRSYHQFLGGEDSDDDVLVIEEERETLVIYDDDGPA